MRRAHLLIGLASAVIAAGVVVFAIDVEDIGPENAPSVPTYTQEERVARLMRAFVTRVIEHELRPKIMGLDGTRVIDGTGGTATLRRTEKEGTTTLRIQFDGYVLRLDSSTTDENEIQVNGTIEYTRSMSNEEVRIKGKEVRIGVFDTERRDPWSDVAGRFTFDLSGADAYVLAGIVERETGARLTLRALPPP